MSEVGFETEDRVYSFDEGVWIKRDKKSCILYHDGKKWHLYKMGRKIVTHYEETEEGIVFIERIKGLKYWF